MPEPTIDLTLPVKSVKFILKCLKFSKRFLCHGEVTQRIDTIISDIEEQSKVILRQIEKMEN